MTSSTNDATNTGPEGRASRITSLSARGLLRVVVGALLLLVTPAWFAVSYYEYSKPTAQASNLIAPVVEIQDETHSFQSVDGRPLSVVLEGIGFLRPTHLVVLSTDNLTDDNLDEATLKYARAKHPEWIARNGYKWADGYFILAVSPTHRQVGTYFGEDIAPVLSIQESIQNAAKDDFRNGRWSQGVVAAVTEAAAVMPNAEGRDGWLPAAESGFSRAGRACGARLSETRRRLLTNGKLWSVAAVMSSAHLWRCSMLVTTRRGCPRATSVREPNTSGCVPESPRRKRRALSEC